MRGSKIFLICSVFLVGSVAAQQRPGSISGNAEQGKELYYDHGCYSCHGYNGIGRQNLANDMSAIMTSEEVFLIYLRARADIEAGFPSQKMPNYPVESLSDKQAKNIYAYIRTFKDNPPSFDDIPALKGILNDREKSGSNTP